MNELIYVLQDAMGNPWTLVFLALWGLGWYLKEYTTVKPQWVLPVVGIALGLALIELSLSGAIVGGLMALTQMGLYDVAKPLIGR